MFEINKMLLNLFLYKWNLANYVNDYYKAGKAFRCYQLLLLWCKACIAKVVIPLAFECVICMNAMIQSVTFNNQDGKENQAVEFSYQKPENQFRSELYTFYLILTALLALLIFNKGCR